jgi:hypothetical protein
LWHLNMCLQCILIRLTLYIIFPHHLSPLLRTISTSFIVLFSSPIFIHLHPLHLPSPVLLLTYAHIGRVLPFCPSFFKCILIVTGCFTLVFHMCIYHTLISFIPSITYSFYSVLLLFTSSECILLYYLHTQMQCVSILFSFYRCLFLSCILLVSSKKLVWKSMISMCLRHQWDIEFKVLRRQLEVLLWDMGQYWKKGYTFSSVNW